MLNWRPSWQKRIVLLFISTGLVLSFQNCIGPYNSMQLRSPAADLKSFGNGGGYEGKPDNEYYRFVPGYTCEGRSSSKEHIEIHDSEVLLYRNQINQCATTPEVLPRSVIETSPFQGDFVTIRNSLYKRYEGRPQGTPQVLAETLCRDNFANPTFEVITHYDESTNAALARVYTKDATKPDFAVSRLISPDKVEYSSNDIKFQIDLARWGGISGRRYEGKVESSSLAGVQAGVTLECVTGGGIDVSYWPLQNLVDIPIQAYHVQKQTGDVYFSGYPTESYYEKNFYRLRGGKQYENLYNKVPIHNAETISAIQDTPYLLMFGSVMGVDGMKSWYLYDTTEQWPYQKITNFAGTDIEEIQKIDLINGGPLILDVLNTKFTLNFPKYQVLRVMDLQESGVAEYFSTNLIYRKSTVLPSVGLVFSYVSANIQRAQLKVLNLKTRKVLDVPLPDSADCIWSERVLDPVLSEKGLIITNSCADGTRHIFMVSVVTLEVKKIADNKNYEGVQADSEWILAAGNESGTAMEEPLSMINLIDGRQVTSSIFKKTKIDAYFRYGPKPVGPYFTNDTRKEMVGLGSGDYPEVILVDLENASERRICSGVAGKALTLQEVSKDEIYLITYNEAKQNYNFYFIQPGGDCLLKNSFPSRRPKIFSLRSLPLGFFMILEYNDDEWGGGAAKPHDLIFVPKNGKASFRLNPDLRGIAHMRTVQVYSQGTKVYLAGYPDLDEGFKAQIFTFSVR